MRVEHTFFSMAWCRRGTISSPTTPEHVKPLVHVANLALAKPSCLHGKEKVNPKGSCTSVFSFFSIIKVSIHPAMWSKSYREKIQDLVSKVVQLRDG